MANKYIQKAVEISSRYTPEEREAIAVDIIRYVRERTLNGKGPGNKAWSGAAGKYSKEYMSSLNFRIGRKDKGKVNMKLSGDMLEAITLLNQRKGKIVYGLDEGDDNAGKAEGNIRGTYGNSSPIAGKARPFLDITEKELKQILSKYPLKDREASLERADAVLSSKAAAQILTSEDDDG